ncbi:MAG: hypothetical protein IPG60_03535 [Bacteroidetes bacterium]|nr:hypothetical protein [Bacteroidota bacterium]MBP7398007.1 hypothetical protein [Chitinophagales bacterium]MBP9187886.1 hypothetical protein [Chitinophagales bacterium]MBP9548176.1 hypothetical protein [Chitinophagales bacterium]MBP9703371.1 hypothetical protein [Chitinophagales bacterium]
MKTSFLLSILTLILASCTSDLIPYTQSLAKDAQLNDEQIKKIQFYVSNDIILYHYLDNATVDVVGGEIKIIDGRRAEEVIIESGTPGVAVGREGNQIMISFDADGSFLRFAPNPGYGGQYTLMAKDWDGRNGIVQYAGSDFYTSEGASVATLLINLQQIDESETTSKTVGGRTVE